MKSNIYRILDCKIYVKSDNTDSVLLSEITLNQVKSVWKASLTSSALLLRRTNLPSRSTSSTVMRPLAEACWLMRVLVTVPPTMLEVSLSLSLRRRFLLLAAPEELRLLEAVAAVAAEADWSKRLAWLWLEPEVRVTMTLVGGGLGDRRSLRREGGRDSDDRNRPRQLVWHRYSLTLFLYLALTVLWLSPSDWLIDKEPRTKTDLGKPASAVAAAASQKKNYINLSVTSNVPHSGKLHFHVFFDYKANLKSLENVFNIWYCDNIRLQERESYSFI